MHSGSLSRRAVLLALPALVLGVVGTTTLHSCRTTAASSYADYTETIRGTDVQFEMVWIEAGGFWIGRTEVTWNEYLLYCDFEEEGKVPPGKDGVDGVSKPSKPLEDVSPFDRDWGLGTRPAVGMSLNAANTYCVWLSRNTRNQYRLPTEAEWELACGKRPEPLAEHAWFAANSGEETKEVGLKKPNEHGLHDILGNLWEYCGTPFAKDQPERAVLRGGSWEDDAAKLTPAVRLGFDDDWVLADPNVPPGVWWVPDGDHLGFRLLRPAPNRELSKRPDK